MRGHCSSSPTAHRSPRSASRSELGAAAYIPGTFVAQRVSPSRRRPLLAAAGVSARCGRRSRSASSGWARSPSAIGFGVLCFLAGARDLSRERRRARARSRQARSVACRSVPRRAQVGWIFGGGRRRRRARRRRLSGARGRARRALRGERHPARARPVGALTRRPREQCHSPGTPVHPERLVLAAREHEAGAGHEVAHGRGRRAPRPAPRGPSGRGRRRPGCRASRSSPRSHSPVWSPARARRPAHARARARAGVAAQRIARAGPSNVATSVSRRERELRAAEACDVGADQVACLLGAVGLDHEHRREHAVGLGLRVELLDELLDLSRARRPASPSHGRWSAPGSATTRAPGIRSPM